jgi:hypothetical protein
MRIRLTRKLADAIDGVAISDYAVGDVIDLDAHEARLLIAEDWAVLVKEGRREVRQSTIPLEVAEAADSARPNAVAQLRRATHLIDVEQCELPHGRRREDVLLEELRDARARTIHNDERDSGSC